jgi:ABC-type branched-subunit amino acid transport system substrate-binding protein
MRRFFTTAATIGVLVAACGLGVELPNRAASATTSDAPIVVGGDGDLAISGGVAQGFEAGIFRFNRAGGLDGRKIEFTGFLDDGFSAQTNLTNAQQLVQSKHVMVVAPFLSDVAGGAVATYLAQNKTPFIGWATSAAFTTQPKWSFGVNGNNQNPDVQGLVTQSALLRLTENTKTPHKVRVALIAENIGGGIAGNNALAGVFKYSGLDVVYKNAPIPVLGTTNYAPYAEDVMAANPTVVFETLDSADSIGLATALKSAGYKGIIWNGVTYFPGQLASQPNEASALDGVYVGNEFPVNENDTPAVRQAEKDLRSVGQPPYLTSGVSVGYWSAIMLEQMLKATLNKVGGDPSKVTGATIQKTVDGGFTYHDPISGGLGTAYFPAAENIPTGCGTVVRITGTTYKQIAPFSCPGVANWVVGKPVNPKTGKPIS